MLMFSLFRLLSLFILYILLVVPTTGQAGIYRYVDEFGKLHFTNVPTTTKFRYYSGEQSKSDLDSLIEESAQRHRLNRALIKAVIKVESNFNPRVVSVKGAQGLMQLMPVTAAEVGVRNPFDPAESIQGGSLYLRKMLDYFDSNLDYALAAYNAGPGAVRRYEGIPPFEETQNYVKRVKHYFDYYSRSKDTL